MDLYSGKQKEPALSHIWLGIEEHTFNPAEAEESQIQIQPGLHRLFQKINKNNRKVACTPGVISSIPDGL